MRVINLAYRVEDFFVNGNRTSLSDIETRTADPATRIIVVDSDEPGVVAACVVVDVHGEMGHFAMLSVDPSFQGRGLGRLLIEAVENHCREAGCDELELEVVNIREELPAFYRAFDFALRGTAPFSNPGKLKREAHLVRMSKSLRPG